MDLLVFDDVCGEMEQERFSWRMVMSLWTVGGCLLECVCVCWFELV